MVPIVFPRSRWYGVHQATHWETPRYHHFDLICPAGFWYHTIRLQTSMLVHDISFEYAASRAPLFSNLG